MFYTTCVVILVLQISLSDAAFDACTNYTSMKYVDRRAVQNQLEIGSINPISDDFLESGWYRIESAAGENMPTEPPGSLRCGTWYPIWLNGTLPTTIGEEIVGQVCLQGFTKNCSLTWNIDIKYCSGDYLVYNLVRSETTSSGYCFGTEAVTATIETPSTSIATNTDDPINGFDPCDQYSLIDYQDRRAATRTLVLGEYTAISDDFLTSGWYRVERSSCEKMPTSAPEPFHCGTWYPIWLNGQLPTTPGQQVQQTVCLQSFTQTCLYSWNVDIKLCTGDFFVYNLLNSKIASSGYCFGTLDVCAVKEDDTPSPNANTEYTLEKETKEYVKILVVVGVIFIIVVVVLSVLLAVYCRKSRRKITNSNNVPQPGKTNKTGISPPLYKRKTSSVNIQSKTHIDSPPPYRSREPSVTSIGNFNPDKKLTATDIFAVKNTDNI